MTVWGIQKICFQISVAALWICICMQHANCIYTKKTACMNVCMTDVFHCVYMYSFALNMCVQL